MSITVQNNAHQEIEVAINKWGDKGDTSFFGVKLGSSESWDRSDERGFVMVVKKGGSHHPYYVQYNSQIIVCDDEVTDHGVTIEHI